MIVIASVAKQSRQFPPPAQPATPELKRGEGGAKGGGSVTKTRKTKKGPTKKGF